MAAWRASPLTAIKVSTRLVTKGDSDCLLRLRWLDLWLNPNPACMALRPLQPFASPVPPVASVQAGPVGLLR